MALNIDNLMESKQFNNFLFDNLTSAIFLLDKNMQMRKINNTYKILFQKNEQESLDQLCGNALGCAFAIEENALCGTTKHCETCTLRNCVMKSFVEVQSIQNTYITRQFISIKYLYKNISVSQ